MNHFMLLDNFLFKSAIAYLTPLTHFAIILKVWIDMISLRKRESIVSLGNGLRGRFKKRV